ncbi:MAG: ATP-binding protein [Oceanisphaera sp.]|uniref:ATP-binding protein n=1 Tax=Oceanisphaera sp. TaxID=1929979 RepID=UPI003F96F999
MTDTQLTHATTDIGIDANAGTLNGFRLQQFEVLNWGTFDQKIWQLNLAGNNSLLTGNIGSGKSTLVDGLTILLVPPRKVAFNKAAGADDKERSLESYFHGYYTSQQDDYGKAKAVGLRGADHYSVLLAQFHSSALAQDVTLAQVFWLKPGERKVRRLFVVAPIKLDLASHFTHFGSKMVDLRKSLRKQTGIEIFDSFAPYQQCFSKLLGLGADGRALELFNQTISMKSVGSVTDFVRQNMLTAPEIEKQIVELESNYDALKRVHDAVVAARQKVSLLEPVSQLGNDALSAAQEKEHFNHSRDLSEMFMASLAVPLYQKRLQQKRQDQDKVNLNLQQLTEQLNQHLLQIEQLSEDIYSQGGGRLQQLTTDIQRLGKERDQRQGNAHRYQQLVRALGLNEQLTTDIFVSNLAQAKEHVEHISQQQAQQEQQRDTLKQDLNQQPSEQGAINDELIALKKRQSNIPLRQLKIREQLSAALNVPETELPFVGELLQIKPHEQAWQGAIERVLHNFALSLLVPEHLYVSVSNFIEQTKLGSRLVYHRVKPVTDYVPIKPNTGQLPDKVEIKPDSPLYAWLDKELAQRFNYHCCANLDDFRRSNKGLTAQGQVKSGPSRHEKDDRYAINDQSRYVLGWSNKQKIQLLTAQYQQLQQAITSLHAQLAQHQEQRKQLDEAHRQALNLAEFDLDFEQLNWPQLATHIEQLQQEYQQLEQSSDQLQALQHTLQAAKASRTKLQELRDQRLNEQGKLDTEIEHLSQELAASEAQLQALAQTTQDLYFPSLSALFRQHCAHESLRIEMLASQGSLLRGKLNDKIQHLEEKRGRKESQMIKAMGQFGYAFPNDVTELDQSLAALAEYQALLSQLQQEDLPRHEQRFKDMLNQDTIRAMALFRSQLDRQEEDIAARIRLINQSLHALDYQDGTYIEVDGVASPDVEIREFKQRLKQCVEYATDDNLYSEQKFEQVKSLIEQMRNEPKWTKKVVDVRYWQLFNVIERYREDNSEKECYSDSGGKSGGQKEKLAYSILAAAILLQYRLVGQEGQQQRRRFNLVVIDEAFARGSKDSTRFGLELFKKLGLQLLLVTPLQKLDIIEHYVQHVHFVDQQQNISIVLNMTIAEYRQQLDQHHQQQTQLQPYQQMIREIN